MNEIQIKEYVEYRKDEILGLYDSVGWSNYVNNTKKPYNSISLSDFTWILRWNVWLL